MIASKDDLSPEQQASLKKVQSAFTAADKLHRQLTPRWDTWYGLSRNYRRFSNAYSQASNTRDKDVVIDELKREFGQELFIPYAFTVIETNVPRILSKNPRYRAIPGELSEGAQEALAPMVALYEQDDAQTHYQRRLQETVRSGLRYGLGVQKDHWQKKCRDGKKISKRLFGKGYKVSDEEIVVYEGPESESVDIFDFFWDPAARDLETARYVIHRTWRDLAYVEAKVKEGKKERAEGKEGCWLELDIEKIKSFSSTTKRGEAWSGRYQAAGITGWETGGDELFEIWEYHDRDNVLTVLGGSSGVLVQEDVNPFLHGDFPFEIYRPTIVEQEFVGVGEVEPIAHLQWELNTLRGQRRDAATLALNRGYFYQQGTLNPANIVVGAGVFNPVLGNPSEAITPMPFTDIPQSGYEEERAIKADIELAAGLSEAVVGSSSAGETATGTQLVQQAAGLRIAQKAKNLHVDLLFPATAKRKALYEQFGVNSAARPVAVPDPTAHTGYRHIEVTPEMFTANWEMVPIDGSTEADDPAQKKHDAAELAQTLAATGMGSQINPEALVNYTLEQHGIEDKKGWIKKTLPTAQIVEGLVSSIGKAMQEANIPPQEIQQILTKAHEASEQGGPPGQPGAHPEPPGESPEEPPKEEEPAPEAATEEAPEKERAYA